MALRASLPRQFAHQCPRARTRAVRGARSPAPRWYTRTARAHAPRTRLLRTHASQRCPARAHPRPPLCSRARPPVDVSCVHNMQAMRMRTVACLSACRADVVNVYIFTKGN
eukprot:6181040-Pleurochrysis_carterae.AAC.2